MTKRKRLSDTSKNEKSKKTFKPRQGVELYKPVKKSRAVGNAKGVGGNHRFITKSESDRNALRDTYKPEYVEQAASMVLNGALERDLIVAFKVTRTIFNQWKLMYPEFAAACAIPNDASLANAAVVRSVFEMANGYTQRQTKVFITKDGDVKRVRYTEHIPKNINAAKFWLMNRDPANWGRDPEKDKNAGQLPTMLNAQVLDSMSVEQLRNVLSLLRSMFTPSEQKQLQRLDTVEAEVIPNEAPNGGTQAPVGQQTQVSISNQDDVLQSDEASTG